MKPSFSPAGKSANGPDDMIEMPDAGRDTGNELAPGFGEPDAIRSPAPNQLVAL